MIAKYIDSLEKKLSECIKETKKRKKKAKKAKVKQYFKGQNDAFKQIVIELKNLKYMLETSVEDDEGNKEEIRDRVEEHDNEHLLKNALEKGIIIRKNSFYFYEDLPNGKVQGKKRIFQAFQEHDLYEKIQRQIALVENDIMEEK